MNHCVIDETLTEVDWKNLFRLAEYHERQAIIIKARATKLLSREDSRNRARIEADFLRTTPKIVLKFINQGLCASQAIKQVSNYINVPEPTLSIHWRNFLRDKSAYASKLRNDAIYDMHLLGLTNVCIADRLNYHPVTISRILSKIKKRRH